MTKSLKAKRAFQIYLELIKTTGIIETNGNNEVMGLCELLRTSNNKLLDISWDLAEKFEKSIK